MNQQRDMSATEGYPNRFGATVKGELSLLLGGLIIYEVSLELNEYPL